MVNKPHKLDLGKRIYLQSLCSPKLIPLPALLTSFNGTTIFPNTQRTRVLSSPISLNQWPSSLDSTAFPFSPLQFDGCHLPQAHLASHGDECSALPSLLLPTKLHSTLALSLSRYSVLTGLDIQPNRISMILQ